VSFFPAGTGLGWRLCIPLDFIKPAWSNPFGLDHAESGDQTTDSI
jgi:hypothetical protein